ncbi:MAG: PQQ-binding-like beta-propeller repeat protein, partial [Myxococcota bacterium]|nr:PQQ-binding-like beta-propeller repeat protein [Myxococcota bacterium]
IRDALAGVPEADDGSIEGRVPVRRIAVPRPPRGGNARFDWGGGRRGWVTALPNEELLTSAAFSNGRIFLGGGFSSHRFFALDAYDGEMVWTVAAPDGGPSAAIVSNDNVIFNTESCTLFVADAGTGEIRWSRWLGDPLMSQPAAAGGLVVSAYPADGAHRFGAYRLSDGEPVWSTPIPADVIQAPQIVGDSVYFATMDGTVHKLALQTGRVLWSRDVGASSAAWVDRGSVLLARRNDRGASAHEQIVVLSARDGRVSHEGDRFAAPYLGGASRDRQLVHGQAGAWGNVPHGEHLGLRNVAAGWAFQGSTPTVADGRAYFAIGDTLLARAIDSGEEMWRRTYAHAEGAQALSPPAIVGSLLIFGTVDGQLVASDIDTGMTVWAYELGEPIVFQPIVAQGWVYVTTARGNVIGLEVGDAMLDGWHMWGGNERHAGPVERAGQVDPALLASLERPTRGTMRSIAPALGDEPESEEATDAVPAPPTSGQSEPAPEELPLRRTRIDARISGPIAEIEVTQEFANDGNAPIEAIYLFPLPVDAAVSSMEMRIGDRVIRGRIQGRSQARRTFEAARASGRRAALLEQQRPNLFAQRVANIQPGDRIEVHLRFVQPLPFENGRYELAFPLQAPARYDAADPTRTARDPLAPGAGLPRAVSATGNAELAARSVSLAVSIDAGMPIGALESPTHDVVIDRGEPSSLAQVRFADEAHVPNRDFVLRYSLGGETPRATVLAHRGGDEGWLTLLVQPPDAPAAETIAPRDLVFVVDASSSMHGRPFDQARALVRRAIGALREGDSVDVLGFSDRVVRMGELGAGDVDALARADRFLDGLRATGATRMVAAIEEGLDRANAASERAPGRVPIVVLVSDGYIANEREVLGAIASHLGASRLYAMGVGSAPNRFLLERAAEVGRGRVAITALGEDAEIAADRFHGWIDRPVFTDVEIDWGGLDVEDVHPSRIPDLFADRPLMLHARYVRGGRATVRVRGSVNGRRHERVIEVALPEAPTPDGPHASQESLWARAAVAERVRRLELRDDPALVQEVTDLGIRHHLVTPYTSFVAVEETPAAPATDGEDAEAEVRATVSPARALPGDPEIRIPAPAAARAVTVILPFGETIDALWEPALDRWTARFLIPRDADEGSYPIEVRITHANG